MLDINTMNQVADRFEAAVVAGEAAALNAILTSDFSLWYAAGNFSVNRSQAMEIIVNLSSQLRDFHYEDVVRYPTDTGYIQRHNSTWLHEGQRQQVPACVILELANGQICHAREYFDSASDPRT